MANKIVTITHRIRRSKWMRWLTALLLTPVLLFCLLCVLIYIPPVQNYVVHRVCETLSDSTGLSFQVDRIRLSFPLDLSVQGVRADQRGDSVLRAEELVLSVELLPLFIGQANVDGLALYDAGINTRDLVSNTQIIGTVGKVTANLYGVNWRNNVVNVTDAFVGQSDITVLLCDTAAEDTSKSAPWVIDVAKAQIDDTQLRLSLPGDTLHLFTRLGKATLSDGHFDTGKPHYSVGSIDIAESRLHYDSGERPLPDAQIVLLDSALWKPAALDFNHIHLEQFAARVAGVDYNENGALQATLERLTFKEANTGFLLSNLTAKLNYDSQQISVSGLSLTTPYSNISGHAIIPMKALDAATATDSDQIDADLQATVGWKDLLALGKGFMPDDMLGKIPHYDFTLGARVGGHLNNLHVHEARVQTPFSNLSVSGDILLVALLQQDDVSPSARDLNLHVQSKVGWQDVLSWGKDYLPKELAIAYPHSDVSLRTDVLGNLNQISLNNLLLQTSTGSCLSGNLSANLYALSNGYGAAQDVFSGRIQSSIAANDIRNFASPFLTPDVRKKLPPYNLTLNTNLRGNPSHIAVSDLLLRTPYSSISGSAEVWPDALTASRGNAFRTNLKTSLGWNDMVLYGGEYLTDELRNNLPKGTYNIALNASGNLSNIQLGNVALSVPGMGTMNLNGNLGGLMAGRLSGKMNVDFSGGDMAFINRLLPPSVTETVHIPNNMRAKGTIGINGDSYLADLVVSQDGGVAKIHALVNLRSEAYDATVQSQAFPLQNFLPTTGLQRFTGTMAAAGDKFDVLSAAAKLTANAHIEALGFDSLSLDNITFDAQSENGLFHANFNASNDAIVGSGTAQATLGDEIAGTLDANIGFVDIGTLARLDDTFVAGGLFNFDFHTLSDFTAFGVDGQLRNMHFSGAGMGFMSQDADIILETSPDTTFAHAESGDLLLDYGASGGLTDAIDGFLLVADTVQKQLKLQDINIYGVRDILPFAVISMQSGKKNPLMDFLHTQNIGYDFADVYIVSSPEDGIGGHVQMTGFYRDKLMLDSIHAIIVNDSTGLALDGMIHNYKRRNPNKFEAQFKAFLQPHGVGAEAQFRDKDGYLGLDLGALVDIEEEGYRLKLYPENPVLAYRTFTINTDNYAYYGLNGAIGAHIDLLADDATGLSIEGEPSDSLVDITLSVARLNLGELAQSVPYVPLMKGLLSGDVHYLDDHTTVSALADLSLNDFEYQGAVLGDLGLQGIYLPKDSSQHYAQAFITTGDEEVLALEGTYFAENEAFEADGSLVDFPLPLLNGFISGTGVALRGTTAGDFTVNGTTSRPILNGQLDFHDGHIYSNTYSFDFRTDSVPILIDNSRLTFTNYKLWSTGANPLVIDGALDMSNLSDVTMNFDLFADDFELINSKRQRESTVFGRAYVDFKGTLTGGTKRGISMRGNLDILPKTDMTYILRDSPLTVDNQLEGLVTFVSFEDSLDTDEVAQEEEGGGFEMTLGVNIDETAHFLCNLSEDGHSYVDISGGGALTLRQTQQGDTRLVGRVTVQKGEMKYELPVIPLKTFTIDPGSYVEFKGAIANPTLSITAKERVKALVTENDMQRSVAFDVGVDISQTVQNMGLQFTIEAPEDLVIQNQLTAMGADQRGKAAVAMLATGMYLAEGTGSSGFNASNALNAFLQSEIQNIAGNALKTIDINLGVEAGTTSKGTNTTDYSFQFSKRFWGDRVSIIIGGRVSAGVDADNSAENFINNVAIEYRLDQASTRLLRLFYNRDTQDPFEGQLTRTGAGIVLRKKSDRLGELFNFRRNTHK